MTSWFAHSLRSKRREVGLTLAEAARLVGLSQSQLSRIERGLSTPSAEMVTRLRQFFDTADKAALSNQVRDVRGAGQGLMTEGSTWPLVGRQRELASITSAVATKGPGGLVLAGAEGVGKTRLAREALAFASSIGRPAAWVAGVQAAASIPFGAFESVVALPQARIHGRHRLLGSATRSLLNSVGRPGVLVLGVDDAHLLDDLSASFVRHLATSSSAFVIATVRGGEPAPDAIVALWKDGWAHRLNVPPLSWPATAQLLGIVLSGYVEMTTQRQLWDATRGHVLFLRELILGGIESGALSNDEGIWRWKGQPIDGQRVREVVLTRLQALTDGQRTLIEVLSVGGALDVRVVEQLAPPEALAELESKGLVQVEMTRGRTEVRLAHPLYGNLLQQRSRTGTRGIKRRLVRAVEEVGAGHNEDIIRLATWRLDAGEPVAGELLTSAAQRAESLFAHELAERLARAAIESGEGFEARLALGQSLTGQSRHLEADQLLAGLVEQASSDTQLARAALVRGANLMFGLVRPQEAIAVLADAEKALLDPRWRDELAALRAYCLVWSARGEEGLALAHQTLNRSRATGRARLQALIAVAAGSLNRAQFADVLAASQQGLPDARLLADELPMAEAQLHGARWWALLGTGQIAEAARLAEEQFTSAIDSRLFDAAAYLAVPYGYSALVQGRARTATRRFLEVMPLLREHDVLGDLRLAVSMLSQAAAIAGDISTAEAALAEAETPSRPTARTILAEVFLRLGRAWVATVKSDTTTAVSMAVEAAEIARNLGAVALEAVALHHGVRLGNAAGVASRLQDLAAQVPGSIADPFARHAAAVLARDGAALDHVSTTFEAMGCPMLAAEAAMDAARAHWETASAMRARVSRHRARALAAQCEDTLTPALALLTVDEPSPLTPREREAAILAAQGLTSKQIADRLGLSVRTVDNHLSHVFDKFGLTSRKQLQTLATRLLGIR